MNLRITYRLIWKELKQVWPLVVALSLIALVLCIFVRLEFDRQASGLLMRSMSWQTLETLRAIMLPSVMAIGIPVLLISNDREFGYDRWMRTLPAHWFLLIGAKLFVGLAAICLLSSVFALFQWGFHSELIGRTLYLVDFTRWEMSSQLAFSLQLMLVAFICSLLLESTIAAVLAVVPLAILSNVASLGLILLLGLVTNVERRPVLDQVGPFAVSGFLLLVVFAIARRQYGLPDRLHKVLKDVPNLAYSSQVVIHRDQPSMIYALLWQQVMQTLPFAALAFSMALLGSIPMMPQDLISPSSRGVGVMFALYGMTLLGLMVFCLESPGSQQTFLAIRGLKPRTVWWTRMLFPSSLSLTTMLIWLAISRRFDVDEIAIAYSLFALFGAFALGVLAGMWIRRPAVAVFAAPVCSILLFTTVMTELRYDNGLLLMPCIGIALTILVATFFLTPRWMDDRRDRDFNSLAISWIGGSLIIGVLLLAGTLPFMSPQNDDQYAKTIFSAPKPSKLARWRVEDPNEVFDAMTGR